MEFLLYLPSWLSIIIVAVVPAGISLLGLKIVRRKFSSEALKENHEVAGFIFNAFGLIYAVLVAFVVFVSWTDYSEAKRNVQSEANLLGDLFIDSGGFPDTMRAEVRSAIMQYIAYVKNEEWGLLGSGGSSSDARAQVRRLWTSYLSTDTRLLSNPYIYQESLKRLNDLVNLRRSRIFVSSDLIPGVIWFVLIICAVASVGYTFFFGTKNFRAQFIMTAVLALINSLVLFLIFILDHPFTGFNGISSMPFEQMYSQLQQLMLL